MKLYYKVLMSSFSPPSYYAHFTVPMEQMPALISRVQYKGIDFHHPPASLSPLPDSEVHFKLYEQKMFFLVMLG